MEHKKIGIMSLKTTIIVSVLFVALILSVGLTTFSSISSIAQNKEQSEEYRRQLEEDVKKEEKNETQIAVSICEQMYAKYEAGEITLDEAKKQAADIIRELRYQDGDGYFYVDTSEGVNVVLLGRDTEGKSRWDSVDSQGNKYIQMMIENGKQDGGGYTLLNFAKPNETEELPKLNYTCYYDKFDWILGTGVWIDQIDTIVNEYEGNAKAHLTATIMRAIIFSIIMFILIAIFAMYLGTRISFPIQFLSDRIYDMSNGNFRDFEAGDVTERIAKHPNELGVIAGAVIKLHSNVRDLMAKINDATSYVASASEELTANAQQSADASELVAQSIVNVAGACSDSSEAADTAKAQSDDFMALVEEFGRSMKENARKIQATNDAATKGSIDIENAMTQMQIIEKSISSTSVVVERLGGEVQTIGTIVDAISEIADQTNLLSLNASIEAARAGEAGKGFAVVADEIRKLADQTNESAGKITELIGGIQSMSDKAVDAMKSGTENVKQGGEIVSNAGTTFGQIVEMVADISSNSAKMEDNARGFAESADTIVEAIETISEKVRGVAEETESVSAAGEQQTASMHEIAEASDKLAETAQELQEAVVTFEL
ncbi:MAG: cache domain-containing protein [Lachnospiraceae bacterium]|nr:cache domain-containing protein [Lachnospiraceae bacterium]